MSILFLIHIFTPYAPHMLLPTPPSPTLCLSCCHLNNIPEAPDTPPYISLPLTYGANQTATRYSGVDTQILPPPSLIEGAASINFAPNTHLFTPCPNMLSLTLPSLPSPHPPSNLQTMTLSYLPYTLPAQLRLDTFTQMDLSTTTLVAMLSSLKPLILPHLLPYWAHMMALIFPPPYLKH